LQTLPFGPVKAFDYGNGLSLTRSFDQDYQLISQTIPGILQSSYQHDPVGNITDWQDLLSTGQDQLFDYDALYRLTSANGAYGDITYTYDATGNRLSLTLDGSTETYSYVTSSHRLQQILGSVTDSRTYDAAGNTIQSLIGSYAYDDTNRMVGFTKTGATATYAYNGKGERISKNVDGTITRFRYAPAGQLLGEYDQNGQAIREYITLEGQPVALVSTDPVTAANTIYYLHTDHLGAVVKATDGTQALVWGAERKPFGERSVTTAQVEMPLGFPGQYFDEESNNYYNYFRDYDPSTGRYIQSDPIGLAGGLNTYVYVGNNPTNYYDPLGLCRITAHPGHHIGGRPCIFPGGGGVSGSRGGSASGGGRVTPVPIPVPVPTNKDECDDCPPCKPPVGTRCYGPKNSGHSHKGADPHWHIYEMEQIPTDCECVWKKKRSKKDTFPFAKEFLQPCSSYPNWTP
ncbi:MAG: RHS repeat-associated core domain-containing protein, partial [Candidatus Thiodiazotropha sp.]